MDSSQSEPDDLPFARDSADVVAVADFVTEEESRGSDIQEEQESLPTISMATIRLSEPASTTRASFSRNYAIEETDVDDRNYSEEETIHGHEGYIIEEANSADRNHVREIAGSTDQDHMMEDAAPVDRDYETIEVNTSSQDHKTGETGPHDGQHASQEISLVDQDLMKGETASIEETPNIDDTAPTDSTPKLKSTYSISTDFMSKLVEESDTTVQHLENTALETPVNPNTFPNGTNTSIESPDTLSPNTNSVVESPEHSKYPSSEAFTHRALSVQSSGDRASKIAAGEDRAIEAADSTFDPSHSWSRPSSLDILGGKIQNSELVERENVSEEHGAIFSHSEEDITLAVQDHDRLSASRNDSMHSRSNSFNSVRSDNSTFVDWVKLDKTEEDESRDETSDESTAFLLARLEHENNTLAIDPRFGGLRKKAARPPSIHVLKKLVNDPTAAPTRYSLLPDPPPMTELEFWAALVKDYPQTALRLPTLTTNKIRGGVPPPLRGVVWMSMCGARDQILGEEYERLCSESSPYENLISKDIGRSFPGVEMFRDPEGEGQKMLGRVLKCFSLYDQKIGYCQGLGFLVGPLLMQMEDKDAFCVLVRLMENYDLRSCFLPDLSGLHLRIYQFQQLLTQHMPDLAEHLVSLQIEPAYLSKWFLSFFAITCPLPMLFRIYDVIFAEGASETMMRVALSLMKRNERRIMASEEFEEVIQLLLGRALWEPYEHNADDLVNDFMRYSPGGSTATDDLTGLVTRESLKALENAFKEAQNDDSTLRLGIFPDVTAAASRFLGRLLTSSTLKPSLSPGTPMSRPSSMLRRTTSKMSLMTMNSADVSSGSNHSTDSTTSTQTTEATVISRESGTELSSTDSVASKSETIAAGSQTIPSKEHGDLHGQIEDLLTALTETQRDQALMATQLQQEREERCEDYRAFRALTDYLRSETIVTTDKSIANRRKTTIGQGYTDSSPTHVSLLSLCSSLEGAVERVEDRLLTHEDLRRSAILETKQRLRESLVRSKDQARIEASRALQLSRQVDEQEQELKNAKDELKDTRLRLQESNAERRKLEKVVQDMRSDRTSRSYSESPVERIRPSGLRSETERSSISNAGGLRELRLGKPSSMQPAPKRTSSLLSQGIPSVEDQQPTNPDELLTELVNAKTSEAMARQELDEVKARLESLRRMMSLPQPPSSSGYSGHRSNSSEVTVVERGVASKKAPNEAVATPLSSIGLGSFWGWGKKSVASANASEK